MLPWKPIACMNAPIVFFAANAAGLADNNAPVTILVKGPRFPCPNPNPTPPLMPV